VCGHLGNLGIRVRTVAACDTDVDATGCRICTLWDGRLGTNRSGPYGSASAAAPLRRDSLRVACLAVAHAYGVSSRERRLVAQIFPRWNPLTSWMRQIEDFQRAA
jgi:hypothetical protein